MFLIAPFPCPQYIFVIIAKINLGIYVHGKSRILGGLRKNIVNIVMRRYFVHIVISTRIIHMNLDHFCQTWDISES
mgnify:CR=1 FL=1